MNFISVSNDLVGPSFFITFINRYNLLEILALLIVVSMALNIMAMMPYMNISGR